MKKLILTLSLVFGFCFTQAQSYVEVNYEMVLDMDVEEVLNNIPKQYRAYVEDQIRSEIAEGVSIDYLLKTNGNESVYELQPRVNNAQGSGGMIANQIMNQDKGVFYKNLKEQRFLKSYDIMGAAYLVNDSLPALDWKVTREKDQVAGFDVRKATGVLNDSIEVTAWFAPKLPFKDGPDRAWGLPGLILKSEFETNGVDITILAREVMVKEEEIEIKKPSKGKEITQKEFEAEMKAFQERMKEMRGGGVDTEE